MKDRLIKTIEDLEEVIKEKKLKVSDDILFTNACSFIRGEEASKNKNTQRNYPFYNKGYPQKQENKKPEPITDPQKKYLDANRKWLIEKGFDIENIQYKEQATKIIGEHKKLLKE